MIDIGVLGMSNREKTTRQTQDRLERLYLSAGLEVPWSSLGGAGGGSWGEGGLGLSAWAAAPAT